MVPNCFLGYSMYMRYGMCDARTDRVSLPYTKQPTLFDCRNECASRPNVRHFLYRWKPKNGKLHMCACYHHCSERRQFGKTMNMEYGLYLILDKGIISGI